MLNKMTTSNFIIDAMSCQFCSFFGPKLTKEI